MNSYYTTTQHTVHKNSQNIAALKKETIFLHCMNEPKDMHG